MNNEIIVTMEEVVKMLGRAPTDQEMEEVVNSDNVSFSVTRQVFNVKG